MGIEEQQDDGEPFEEKMARLTKELSELFRQSHELEAQIRERLRGIGYEVVNLLIYAQIYGQRRYSPGGKEAYCEKAFSLV